MSDKKAVKRLVLEIIEQDGKVTTNFSSSGLNRPEVFGVLLMAQVYYKESFAQEIMERRLMERARKQNNIVIPGRT